MQARQPRDGALVVERRELALQAAHGASELERASRLLALPERHLRRLAGRGGDDHAIALDLLDPPGGRAEQEDLALARLVHHLLVELADAAAAVDQEDAVEAAVGDGARVRDGDALRALARAQRAGRALPHDARAQLGELVRGVAPGEQVEHVLELLARQLAIRVGALDERVQVVDLQLLDRGHGDDLLAQHVERDARHARVLDLALEHAARDRRGLDELAAEARVDAPARGCARPSARRDRRAAARSRPSRARTTWTTRSTAPMSMPSSSEEVATMHGRVPALSASSTSLRASRESEPWWARATGSSLSSLRRSASRSARRRLFDEHDRRVVRAHELEQLGVERRPERVRASVVRALHVGERRRGLRLGLDRHLDAQVELLAHAGIDDVELAVAADEARDLLERPLRGRERDALRVVLAERGEALERERQMRAALRRRDGVHLVDDHRLDAGEHLSRARGEQQVEALGRRDQHVGRRPQHPPALLGRRIARTHRDARRRQLEARGRGRRADARERRAQVALDVVVERLEWRDVEHPQALAGFRHEAVEEPQERRKRLARPGGRAHEHVLARGDRRPAQRLRRRGRAERVGEPAPCVRREACERVNGGGGHRRRTIRPTRGVTNSAQEQVEREQSAGRDDHRRGERDARRDEGVARPAGALARGEQRADRGSRRARSAASDAEGSGYVAQNSSGATAQTTMKWALRARSARAASTSAPIPPASGPVPAE